MVRVVQEENPEWYRDFCGNYESNRSDALRWRRFKTSIKRADTLRGLLEIARGELKSTYAHRLINVVKREYERDLSYVPF